MAKRKANTRSKPSAAPARAARSKAPAKTATTTPARSAKPATMVEAKTPTREQIAEAAYFRWLENGGSDLENWLHAESTILAETHK